MSESISINPAVERDKNIAVLESLASQIITLKETSLPRRPIVIEFCGSPKAGKSSCISSLSMFLRRNGIRNIVLSERGATCPITNKFDPNFNIWAGCSGLMEFSEIMSNRPKDFDVVIMDRGLFDAVTWFFWQKKLLKLDEYHYEKFVQFFLAPKWISKISILYIFKANPDVSLKREYATLLTKKFGTIMRPEVLEDFNRAIDECCSTHGVHFGQKLKMIDTSYKNQDEVNFQVTQDILQSLRDLIVEKIGHFGRRVLKNVTDEVFEPKEIFNEIRQLDFSARNTIENDDGIIQPIPVAVITDMDEQKIVVAKKLRTATSEDSPERRRDLIYFGGHIREEDELGYRLSGGGVRAVAAAALSRELKEELDIDYDLRADEPKFCIWDRNNSRSRKHVALVYHIKVNRQSLRIVADRKEFAEKGAYIIDRQELTNRKPNFERWGEIIYERLFFS
ncbi:MAG TPA: hypothetical protein VIJ46_00690 [Rhabdochlamydiaceae bacterium]